MQAARGTVHVAVTNLGPATTLTALDRYGRTRQSTHRLPAGGRIQVRECRKLLDQLIDLVGM